MYLTNWFNSPLKKGESREGSYSFTGSYATGKLLIACLRYFRLQVSPIMTRNILCMAMASST